jgi:hypothetical protein
MKNGMDIDACDKKSVVKKYQDQESGGTLGAEVGVDGSEAFNIFCPRGRHRTLNGR